MKKWFALLMVALMVFCGTIAFAEEIDLSGMTEEELIDLIDNARLELIKYHPSAIEGTVLYEDENVCVTFAGNIEVDKSYSQLGVGVIVENYSDHNVSISLQNVSCNGWSIWESSVQVPANKKAKAAFYFMNAVEDAEIEEPGDVQDIEADVFIYDSDTWDALTDSVHVTWIF